VLWFEALMCMGMLRFDDCRASCSCTFSESAVPALGPLIAKGAWCEGLSPSWSSPDAAVLRSRSIPVMVFSESAVPALVRSWSVLHPGGHVPVHRLPGDSCAGAARGHLARPVSPVTAFSTAAVLTLREFISRDRLVRSGLPRRRLRRRPPRRPVQRAVKAPAPGRRNEGA